MRIDVRSVRRLAASELTTGAAGLQTIGEPSIAIRGDEILLAGNAYAARSLDRGVHWQALDPHTYLDPPPPTGFCCDQTIYYDVAHDLTFWLLQYWASATGNTLRLAVKRGSFGDADWLWWDFSSTTIDPEWTKEELDYNHAAATEGHFFVGTNVYGLGGKNVFRSIILRFPFHSILSAIDSGTALEYDLLEESTGLRCAIGASDRMYIAGHLSYDEIVLYSWGDSDVAATSVDIRVAPWTNRSYSAPGPDGHDWMSRCDDRIMTGVVANGRVVWMWTANRFGARRPYPYVRVVVIDPGSGALIEEPDIWSPEVAYAYPDAARSASGVVGLTLFMGGNAAHPSHLVGAYDEAAHAWVLATAVKGTNGPMDGLWGDYLTCRATGASWVAAGFTLQGGPGIANLIVDVVEFALG